MITFLIIKGASQFLAYFLLPSCMRSWKPPPPLPKNTNLFPLYSFDLVTSVCVCVCVPSPIHALHIWAAARRSKRSVCRERLEKIDLPVSSTDYGREVFSLDLLERGRFFFYLAEEFVIIIFNATKNIRWWNRDKKEGGSCSFALAQVHKGYVHQKKQKKKNLSSLELNGKLAHAHESSHDTTNLSPRKEKKKSESRFGMMRKAINLVIITWQKRRERHRWQKDDRMPR